MAHVSFYTWTHQGEPEEIHAADLAFLPRKGETVYITGKEFGESRGDDSTEFVVDDVYYNVDADDGTCEVVIYLAQKYPEFRKKCVKESQHCKHREDNADICDDCGGRIV